MSDLEPKLFQVVVEFVAPRFGWHRFFKRPTALRVRFYDRKTRHWFEFTVKDEYISLIENSFWLVPIQTYEFYYRKFEKEKIFQWFMTQTHVRGLMNGISKAVRKLLEQNQAFNTLIEKRKGDFMGANDLKLTIDEIFGLRPGQIVIEPSSNLEENE